MSMISRMVEVFRLQPEAERNVLVFTHTHTHTHTYVYKYQRFGFSGVIA